MMTQLGCLPLICDLPLAFFMTYGLLALRLILFFWHSWNTTQTHVILAAESMTASSLLISSTSFAFTCTLQTFLFHSPLRRGFPSYHSKVIKLKDGAFSRQWLNLVSLTWTTLQWEAHIPFSFSISPPPGPLLSDLPSISFSGYSSALCLGPTL